MRHVLFLLVSLSLSRSAHSLQDHWPAWRGPLGTGAAPEADPPIDWGVDENIAWVTPLPGHGKSTPIVDGGRIYFLAAVPGDEASAEVLAARPSHEGMRTEAPTHLLRFCVLALDRKSGAILWQTTVAERLPVTGVHRTNGYASFSPVTDGERVYASFGSYGVYALDAATGEVRWSHELGPQVTRRGWGEGGSPALVGDALVVVADQEGDSFIVALDTKDGSVRWKAERDEASTWTTPLVVGSGEKAQVVVNGTNAVRSYDPRSGAVLWHCDGQTANAIPTPVSDGERVLVTSGFRGSACVALPLSQRGDLRAVEGGVHWSDEGGTPYVPSPVLVDGLVYMTSGNSGILSCFDLATGERLIDRQRLDLAQVYASPLAAAGRIYVTGRDGTTVVFRHGEELEILAVNSLDDPIDASPVAVGKALFLRSESRAYAIGTP